MTARSGISTWWAMVVVASAWTSIARGQPSPVTTHRQLLLGSTPITLVSRTWGTAPFVCCNMHDDENTAVEAAEAVLALRGGRLEELRHQGTRNIRLPWRDEALAVDPNRIFTRRGVRATLGQSARQDEPAQAAVADFGQALWQAYRGAGSAAIIAVHNNSDEEYSVRSYATGGPLAREAAAVAIAMSDGNEPRWDADDFFFVTDPRLFAALRDRQWNVVLQDNDNATDDGSLSVLCGREGVPYINVEAQHGHRKVQEAMLHAAFDVVAPPPMTGNQQQDEPAETNVRPEEDVELVDLRTLDPTLVIDARYATANNIVGKPLYPGTTLFLERDAAERLKRAQASLRKRGLGIKVLDAYRPLSVQRQLWKMMPDPRYVADPAKGSRHNRGSAVDVTLVDSSGRELTMPTAFDEFSEKAHRDFQDLPAEVIGNRTVLEEAMVAEGFEPLPTEWWHFDAPHWRRFPVMDRNPYAEQDTPGPK